MIKQTIKAARALVVAALLAAPMAYAQASAAQQAPSTLPNGANAINETYNDWIVLCSSTDKGRSCLLTQQQRKKDTNQLVLAVELTPLSTDQVKGVLLLPFGLRLADGVTLQIDDGPVSTPLPFATCLPTGCTVQVAFDTATTKALRLAKTLRLVAKANDGGQTVLLGVSLAGFSSAYDRVLTLSRQ
jgi:invasion protein IalB